MIPTLLGILLAAGIALLYNRLVTLRNRYRQTFSQIDVQLKRRYDLIPNLVNTAKGYLAHERETLENVVAARSAAVSASDAAASRVGEQTAMRALSGAETTLLGALGRLMAIVERYPDLKANQTMAGLMEELTTAENRIAFARQAYNDAVMFYNSACQTFPTNTLAPVFGFNSAAFFVVEGSAEKQAPNVSFP